MENEQIRPSKLLEKIKIPAFAFLVGFLRAFGGSSGTSKNWGRIGVALLATVYAYVHLYPLIGLIKAIWALSIMTMAGAIAMGHGIPDNGYPEDPTVDEGSTLGRFFYNLFNCNHLLADIFTRGLIGVMITTSLLVMPIVKGNWILYVLCGFGIVISQATISWRGFGVINQKVFGKQVELLVSDLTNWSIIGFLISIIITF